MTVDSERVEKLRGLQPLVRACPKEGDRGLDAAMCMACFPGLREPRPLCVGDEPIFWDEPFRKQEPPQLTSSIDAARDLVRNVLPPAWIRLDEWTDVYTGCHASILPKKRRARCTGGKGASLPLALLDALLSALLAQAQAGPTATGEGSEPPAPK